MIRVGILAALAGMTLAACAPTYEAPEQATEIKPDAGKTILRRETILVQSAFVSAGALAQLNKTTCSVRYGKARAVIRTPMKIDVPVYAGTQGTVRLDCMAEIGAANRKVAWDVTPALGRVTSANLPDRVYPEKVAIIFK